MIRRRGAIQSNPVLIGAVTILVAVVGVYITYNANNGLPFAPAYRLQVDAPSALHLGKGAEVRVGGARVGRVARVEAVPRRGRPPVARLHLELDPKVQPLPNDTEFRLRPAGSIGLEYVEVLRGTSRRGFADGAITPVAQVRTDTVHLEEFFGMFDAPARTGQRAALGGYAYGVAGRGRGLNRTIAALPPVLSDLTAAMRTFGAPETELGRFVRSLSDFAGELAPVAAEQGRLVRDLGTTFTAFGDVAEPYLVDAIASTPPAFDAVVAAGPRLRTLLSTSAQLAADLRPGAAALPATSRALSGALRTGAGTLPALSRVSPRLESLSARLASYAASGDVLGGVERLRQTTATLDPLTSFFTPSQTTCRYLTLALRNAASLLAEGPETGTTARAGLVAQNASPSDEVVLASRPAPGPEAKAVGMLHSNPYPNTAAPGQERECEAGQEPYARGRQVIGTVPGNQDLVTEREDLP
jgi:ABC-type transporter Mla subunit MlaD